jgi:threonine synthase
MSRAAPWLACAGCGRVYDARDALPFRCTAAVPGDDIDHVIARPGPPAAARWPDSDDDNPFVRYRTLMYAWHYARARGLPDQEYLALVDELDAALREVDGRGFQITPCVPAPALAGELGLTGGQLCIKDETGNVGGSHKARHLMGLAIYLAVAERLGALPDAPGGRVLAIASCGNAALAAAVVARAANRRLRVFIPPWPNASDEPAIVTRMRALGAELEVCERRPGDAPGDPCYSRFRAAVSAGALPFACQGSENGLTIDGGMTLAWELVDQLAGTPLDRIVVQVGGGALASACAQGFAFAHALGALERIPVIHAVQSQAVQPLVRAWRIVLDRARRASADHPGAQPEPAADRARIEWQRDPDNAPALAAELERAAHHRSEFMWPVEQPGHSLAGGILDDETYDWLAVVRAMIATQGWPVVVDEALIEHAYRRAHDATGILVSATGSAGLAGALALGHARDLRSDERVVVLFTGVSR